MPFDGTTTFERLAGVVGGFAEKLGREHYALYVFDFGAPVGLTLATLHPERVDALIVQNGNAYEAGPASRDLSCVPARSRRDTRHRPFGVADGVTN